MRSRWKLNRVSVGLMALIVTAFVAVLGAQTASSSAKASDTIVIAIPGTPQGVDLDFNSGPQTWTLSVQVMGVQMPWARVAYPYPPVGGVDNSKIKGLTYPDFAHLRMANTGLLTSCELKDGGKLALYHLRHGVKSAWGNEFNADDILFRVHRANANKAISKFMIDVMNAGNNNQWSKVDKYTVKITSPTPMPLICETNSNNYWGNVPDSVELKKHVTADDPWGNKWLPFHGTYYGPYYITKWVPGQEVRMEANPNWYAPVAIKHIIYKVVPESSNRVALLQNGSVQLIEGVSPEDVVSLNTKKGVHVVAVRGNQSLWLEMNNLFKPFDNVKVRQAINYAIPRKDIVDQVYRGFAQEWAGVMPSVYPGFKDFKTYTFDLVKAKALLAEAGYPNGFKDVLAYNAGDPVQANIAVLLQSTLKKIGVEVTLSQQPPGPYSDLIQGHKFHMGIWIDFPIQPDINYDLTLANKSKAAVNYQTYFNADVDRILLKCLSVVGAKRIPCNQEAAKIISDTASLGWIAEPYYLSAMSDKIAGFGWDTAQYYRVSELSYTS